MRRRLQLCTLLFAWLLSTGSQWDAVQTFGWARMIVLYSQSMPLSEAVRLTFTADNLCGVCETVGDAKRSDDPATPAGGKLGRVFVFLIPVALTGSPVVIENAGTGVDESVYVGLTGRGRYPPPVPPPRSRAS